MIQVSKLSNNDILKRWSNAVKMTISKKNNNNNNKNQIEYTGLKVLITIS